MYSTVNLTKEETAKLRKAVSDMSLKMLRQDPSMCRPYERILDEIKLASKIDDDLIPIEFRGGEAGLASNACKYAEKSDPTYAELTKKCRAADNEITNRIQHPEEYEDEDDMIYDY